MNCETTCWCDLNNKSQRKNAESLCVYCRNGTIMDCGGQLKPFLSIIAHTAISHLRGLFIIIYS